MVDLQGEAFGSVCLLHLRGMTAVVMYIKSHMCSRSQACLSVCALLFGFIEGFNCALQFKCQMKTKALITLALNILPPPRRWCFHPVCFLSLLVGWFVRPIMQKHLHSAAQNLVGGCSMCQGRTHYFCSVDPERFYHIAYEEHFHWFPRKHEMVLD